MHLLQTNWFVHVEVIAEGLSTAAIEGRHYYRNMRLLKESFNSLIQFRTKDALESMQELCDALRQLNECPSREKEHNILQSNEFKLIYDKVFDTQATQLITAYLKDVSSLLSLIRTAREGDYI